MKKFLFSLVAVMALVASSDALSIHGRYAKSCATGSCGPRPVCLKQVEVPACPVYETTCHWECPVGTERQG